ncbi:MAG: amidohydrolase family protein [Bacillota bacterium]
MGPIIDFHIHPIYYEYYRESTLNWIKALQNVADWDDFYAKYSDPAYFVDYLKRCKVDYAVIMADYTPLVVGMCTNEYVLRFCRDHEELIPFASINPYMTANMAAELKRLVNQGFRGLKLYPTYQYFYANEPMLYPLYACAQELQVPIMFHTGTSLFKGSRLKYGDPLYLDDVAVDFPGLKILMVHSGRGIWYDRAVSLCRLHENIYMEVAGLPPQKLQKYFPEMDKIPNQIIFGSDWPGVIDIAENIALIKKLDLPAETKTKMLGGNAARLLCIDPYDGS